MKKKPFAIAVLVLLTALPFGVANAKTSNSPALSDDETRQSICTMISQGSLTVAVARQKGEKKAATKKAIDDTIAQLKKRFNPKFVDYIAKVWYADIERIYKMPILKTADEKVAFASMIEELNYSQCMGKDPQLGL